jgi:hypothetical protein
VDARSKFRQFFIQRCVELSINLFRAHGAMAEALRILVENVF